jgi:sulfite reductase beta subunit-like hemoprotein
VRLPSRINISLGGCPDCGVEALTNDIGLVACVRDGVAGYQLWAGGSLGAAPRLAMMLRPFVTRDELWPAVWTIVEWFCREVGPEQTTRARLKFAIEARGENAFRAAFAKDFAMRCAEPHPRPPAIVVPDAHARDRTLAEAPTLGWRNGIEPERRAGYASITVRVPLGDLLADELEEIGRVAPTGRLMLTRGQNILIRSVPVKHAPVVVGALAGLALGPDGARGAVDVRACPGLAFCSLAITASQPIALAIERALHLRPDLPRDATIAVSGCPNACTKHQAADLGFAGAKVKVGARIALGYQLFLGADLGSGLVGEPVLRLLDDEVPDAVVAAVETWTALRRPGEPPGATFRRAGLSVIGRAIEMRLRAVGRGDRPTAPENGELAVAS